MRDAIQLIRDAVLDAVADDYESLEVITSDIRSRLHSLRAEVTTENVSEALAGLVRDGLVQTFVLSSSPPHAVPVSFSYDTIAESWFCITPFGKAALGAREP
jgi:aryl-alcohol dehydrogenase-like predicted oxidoreductase